jgi:LPXTG-site transpeptidase (sortase) family protein
MIRFVSFFLASCISSILVFSLSHSNIDTKFVNSVDDNYNEVENRIEEMVLEDDVIIQNTSQLNSSNVEEKELMILEIPKIGVRNKIYNKKSILNDIDKNVIIMDESDYPSKEGGTVILGAHSGIGKLAYFKHLNQLEVGDFIYVTYNNKKYSYIITESYLDLKDGSIVINNYNNLNRKIYLYTCNPKDKNNFLIVVGEEK